MPDTYTVAVAREIAERFTEWTSVKDLGVDWLKVEPRPDGTAMAYLAQGEEPPRA